ncbi:hypothetical protein CLOM_g14504 [Closterium sp. NIES-68]|nr:hypothetical protein CLOM_g14504 [Closterium sp. NIES-68]GJP64023.1 hypothetical protein CLOP_g21057 [Closterium sp. NIES-67]
MAPYNRPLEPSIAAQVAVLCSFPKVGFQVRDVRCGWEDAEFADRFTVLVPCGWDKLEWYVQFNASRPGDPPDVIFHSSPDGLRFHPLLLPGAASASDSSSWGLLKDWQQNDSYRLVRLLLHLRALFLQHQRRQAEAVEDERVKFELGTLAHQEFEVYAPLAAGKSSPEELQLAVPVLGVDLRPLTLFRWWSEWLKRCGSDLQLRLLIKFPISGSSSSAGFKPSTPQLKLDAPPLLLSLLGFPETKLPAWTDSMCTVAYLPELAAFIHQRLDDAVSSMQSRADFVSALPAVFGQPLETDTQLFSQTTVFVSASNCMFLVRIALPPSFPQQQPSLTLQSAHHFTAANRPVSSEPISSFPWSPRWATAQMAQRLGSFLEEEGAPFKRFCVDVSRGAGPARP